MTTSKEIRFAGRRVIVNDPTRYPQAAGKANSFATAIGPFSGVGYVILRRRDLEPLNPGGEFDLTFTTEDDGNSRTVTFTSLVIDKAVKIGSGADGVDDTAFLVRLVDRRWHLCRWTSTFRRFNVRSWSGGEQLRYFDEKWIRETIKAPETPWKNSEIVAQLWNDCSFAGPLPPFPVDDQGRLKIDQISQVENLHFNGVNAWVALHDVLHQAGWTTALDHTTGRFSFVELGGQQSLKLTNDRVLYNAERWSGGTTYAPERITVAFPIHYDDYGSERDTEVQNNFVTSWSAFSYTIPTGAQQAVAGSHLTIWDSTRAVRRHASWQIDNAADLFNRALSIVLGYLGDNAQGTVQSSGDRAHSLYSGLQDGARLGSRLKAIVVRDYGRDPERGDGDGLVTELIRHPGTPKAAKYFGEDAVGCGERSFVGMGFEFSDRNIIEHQDGLDFGRPTFPNYPRLPNIVKLTKFKTADKCCVETEEVSGEDDPGDARIWAIPHDPVKKLFGGVVHRYDAASGFDALEECWIYFPNYPSDVFKIQPNSFFYARLSGQETDTIEGRKLPLYVATSQVRALPSWSNECLFLSDSEEHEFEHGFGACDVKTIAVDAASSLALYRRTRKDDDGEPDDDAKCKPSVAITIKGSPYPCSVFWTGEKKTPQWTVSPKVKTLQAKTGIELGEGDEATGSSVWILPGGQSAKIKLPSNTPAGAGVTLMTSGVDGDCVATKWGPKGVTAEHDFVENVEISYSGGVVWMYGDCDCYLYQSPLTITLDVDKCPIETDRGIVVQLCDNEPGSDQGSADCGDPKHCKPLDPCDPPVISASGKLTCCEDTTEEEEETPGLLPPIEEPEDSITEL